MTISPLFVSNTEEAQRRSSPGSAKPPSGSGGSYIGVENTPSPFLWEICERPRRFKNFVHVTLRSLSEPPHFSSVLQLPAETLIQPIEITLPLDIADNLFKPYPLPNV